MEIGVLEAAATGVADSADEQHASALEKVDRAPPRTAMMVCTRRWQRSAIAGAMGSTFSSRTCRR
jgi:hypothetical protein